MQNNKRHYQHNLISQEKIFLQNSNSNDTSQHLNSLTKITHTQSTAASIATQDAV